MSERASAAFAAKVIASLGGLCARAPRDVSLTLGSYSWPN